MFLLLSERSETCCTTLILAVRFHGNRQIFEEWPINKMCLYLVGHNFFHYPLSRASHTVILLEVLKTLL